MAENHKGMQKLGTLSESGFALEDLQKAKIYFEEQGKICLLVNLSELLSGDVFSEPARLLVVRKYLDKGSAHVLHQEQSNLTWDSKIGMRCIPI
ncbi:2OG-Fe(II) oxygenase [Brazilian cedratvirus IHUMI]|uniref:2OG-Fe(II) oxygenase n=1 Tax=Brazilian cedratvirus IHUMI TaxID=2126980 RepID=A0A2R8FFF7_9VIRU|nr:2OG-Fe(II) oxygenase [Brazilian cedratvirus IHUMI]